MNYEQYNNSIPADEVELRKKHNLFNTKEEAAEFADKSKPVRVGFWNFHNVYKINDSGDLIFSYHFFADSIGNFSKC